MSHPFDHILERDARSGDVLAVLIYRDGRREQVYVYPGSTMYTRRELKHELPVIGWCACHLCLTSEVHFKRSVEHFRPEWSGPIDAQWFWSPLDVKGQPTGRLAFYYWQVSP